MTYLTIPFSLALFNHSNSGAVAGPVVGVVTANMSLQFLSQELASYSFPGTVTYVMTNATLSNDGFILLSSSTGEPLTTASGTLVPATTAGNFMIQYSAVYLSGLSTVPATLQTTLPANIANDPYTTYLMSAQVYTDPTGTLSLIIVAVTAVPIANILNSTCAPSTTVYGTTEVAAAIAATLVATFADVIPYGTSIQFLTGTNAPSEPLSDPQIATSITSKYPNTPPFILTQQTLWGMWSATYSFGAVKIHTNRFVLSTPAFTHVVMPACLRHFGANSFC
jgi:hypothetical protein